MVVREWVVMYSPVDSLVGVPCPLSPELEDKPVLTMFGVKVFY